MKKNFFVKIFLLLSVMMLAVACIIDDPVAGPIIGGGNPGGEDPDVPVEQLDITIDGNFSDWDAIPSEELVVSEVPADAFYAAGKKVMVCADKTYIYLYVEFKNTVEQPVQIMHLYLDSDMAFEGGKPTTGYGNTAWTNDGSDRLLEGHIVDEETGDAVEYDPSIYSFTGEPLSANWDGWAETVAPGVGVCSKSAHIELPNGNTAFEMTILRDGVPGLGNKFRMGVALQYDWSDIAFLPAGSAKNSGGTLEHGPAQNLLIGAKATVEAASVTIDGTFDDWDALPAASVAETVLPADFEYGAAQKLKVASNADYLYLYLEYDGSAEADAGILDLFIDTDAAVDAEGNSTTGAGGWSWVSDGSDALFQGAFIGDGVTTWDPDGFLWVGEPMSGGWDWSDPPVVPAGSGAATASAPVVLDGDKMAMEIAVLRSAIPGLNKTTKRIKLGVMLEKNGWNGETGILPAQPNTVLGEFSPAEQLKVTLF